MKKTLLFTLGLLAASTTAWADVVDFLSTSGFKAYKIQARRGPNAAGTAYDNNSGKGGGMLTNKRIKAANHSSVYPSNLKVQRSSMRLIKLPIFITTSC